MKKLFSSIIGSYVYENGYNKPIAIVRDLVVNPLNGFLVGVVVDKKAGKVIAMNDILYFGEFLQIKDSDCIVDYEDVIRIREIVDGKRYFNGAIVETESGDFLGNVYDYDFNSFFVINSLYVAKRSFIFLRDKKIINSDNIIIVKKGKIIVKDSYVKVEKQELESQIGVEGIA